MNTNRYPYQAPERKHEAYGVPSISDVDLDGLTVYLGTGAPIKNVIVAYPNIASAEAQLGAKGVRSSLVWELLRDNPGVQIDLRLQVGA
jgi:hypothetical protein